MTSETPENPIQITNHIETRLSLENYKENYPHWQKETFDVLRGRGLLQQVIDSTTRPSPYLADGTVSYEFERWQTQDQLIWYWMCSSLPSNIRTTLGQLAHDSSHLLWKSLHSMYTSTSFPSVLQLEFRLQTIKKGDTTCSQYLDQIEQIADCLRSRKAEMSEQDLVQYTLVGLGQEFNHFEWPVKLHHLTMAQLKSHLLFVHQHKCQICFKFGHTAHYCIGYGEVYMPLSSYERQVSESMVPASLTSVLTTDPDQVHLENVADRGRSNYNEIGCSSTFPPLTDGQSQCQICFKYGHTARYCLKYRQEFLPPLPSERQLVDSEDPMNLTSVLNSSQFAGQTQYAPPSQPVTYYSQLATNPYAGPGQQPLGLTLNLDNVLSSLSELDYVENGAGLGAEDSYIARSLPQDTSLIEHQTRDPAARGSSGDHLR